MSKLSVKSEAANGGGEMGDVPLENWGDVPIPGKLEGGGDFPLLAKLGAQAH